MLNIKSSRVFFQKEDEDVFQHLGSDEWGGGNPIGSSQDVSPKGENHPIKIGKWRKNKSEKDWDLGLQIHPKEKDDEDDGCSLSLRFSIFPLILYLLRRNSKKNPQVENGLSFLQRLGVGKGSFGGKSRSTDSGKSSSKATPPT